MMAELEVAAAALLEEAAAHRISVRSRAPDDQRKCSSTDGSSKSRKMSSRREVDARSSGVQFGRCDELLLLGVIVVGALFPVFRGTLHAEFPILCGLPEPTAASAGYQALVGKMCCALALAVLMPVAARAFAGSWIALARSSAYRVALGVAGVCTATLTAYDACTGFHAARPMAEGCTCWLTALLAGVGSLVTVLLILGGRALVELLRDAIVGMFASFRSRLYAAPSFSDRNDVAVMAAAALLARLCAGRGPPELALQFA